MFASSHLPLTMAVTLKLTLIGFVAHTIAGEQPAITPAPRLHRRQDDPALVGYVEQAFYESRRCDYPQTVSTSGSYVQCCPATGECPFYTTCSSNTLLAANATVPCDVDATLACNTGLVFATRDAADPASYLACWQTSLGSDALTIIQSVDETAVAGGSTRSASGSGSTSETSSGSSTARQTASATDTTSDEQSATSTADSSSAGEGGTAESSSSAAAAAGGYGAQQGGLLGAMVFVAQLLV
ncbi:hypothetical protein WHR41_00169 [Cladosporium halotolerans]|uniref:Uncharacterized protein n=1 Tax=Cladosporium halotolerans TaxID=1052096 RepID=A0AB34L2E7_9PEZI